MSPTAPLRVGVMMEAVQSTDVACVDVLGNCSIEYCTASADFGNARFLPVAREMEFLWLASDLEPAFMTPGMKIVPTHTYDNAPRDLDILVVGGPLLTHRPAASLKFMKEAAEQTKLLMTTCVGALWLADAGVLKGRKATTNRFALPLAKQMHPDVDWIDQRWVVDDSGPFKLWTSGGAGAGIDMMGAYVQTHFDPEMVKTACLDALDFDPSARGQFYK